MEAVLSMLEQIANALINCDEQTTAKLVEQALSEGLPPKQILDDGLLAGMSEVGRRFRDGEYFVPEVLIAAEAMKAGTAILAPHLVRQGVKAAATAIIGTVKGDLHDIGKNLVATMLEGAGFEVVDLGVDVPAGKFVETCRARSVQLVGLSALLTTTMPMMAEIVRALREQLDASPVILIGGAPVTETYAREIGADGYGRDAATGAELAKQLCLKRAS
jgi:5-methyltetrahydrofolate--homocysteine methyltransferase